MEAVMSVFVDEIFDADPMLHAATNPRARQAASWGTRWCHMWADTPADIPELHRIAWSIGLHPSYFQDKPGFPHYDLVPNKRRIALKRGAVEKNLMEWLHEKEEPSKPMRTVSQKIDPQLTLL
jgi:hypothetical protein